MKLVIVAGPPSAGKTAVIRQIVREFLTTRNPGFLKIDVVRAFEDDELREEFGIRHGRSTPAISAPTIWVL